MGKNKKINWMNICSSLLSVIILSSVSVGLYFNLNKQDTVTELKKSTKVSQRITSFDGSLEELIEAFDYKDDNTPILRTNIDNFFSIRNVPSDAEFYITHIDFKPTKMNKIVDLNLKISKTYFEGEERINKNYKFTINVDEPVIIVKNTAIKPIKTTYSKTLAELKTELQWSDSASIIPITTLKKLFLIEYDVPTATYTIPKLQLVQTRGIKEIEIEILPSRIYVEDIDIENTQPFSISMNTTEIDLQTEITEITDLTFPNDLETFKNSINYVGPTTPLELGDIQKFANVKDFVPNAKYMIKKIDFAKPRAEVKINIEILPTLVYEKDEVIIPTSSYFVSLKTTEKDRNTVIKLQNDKYNGTLEELRETINYSDSTTPYKKIDLAHIFSFEDDVANTDYFIENIDFKNQRMEKEISISIKPSKIYIDDMESNGTLQVFTMKTEELAPMFDLSNGMLSFNEEWLSSSQASAWDGNLVIPAFIDNQPVLALYGDDNITDKNQNSSFSTPVQDKIKSLRFETNSQITTIPREAFSRCKNLKGNIELPESTKIIGDDAFLDCEELDGSLIIPKNLKSIGDQAFSGCLKLSGKLELPQALEKIGERAFNNCSKLNGQLIIPGKISDIPNEVFKNTGFDDILNLPNTIVSVGESAFENSKITNIASFPSKLNIINSRAFANCENLSGTIYADSVNIMGEEVFAKPNSIEAVIVNDTIYRELSQTGWAQNFWDGNNDSDFSNVKNISELPIIKEKFTITKDGGLSITDIKSWDFDGWNAELVIPAEIGGRKVKYLKKGNEGFSYQIKDKLKTVSFENNIEIESFQESSFEGCINLETIEQLPESLKVIGEKSFKDTTKLRGNLIIPNEVSSMGNQVFDNSSLEFIVVSEMLYSERYEWGGEYWDGISSDTSNIKNKEDLPKTEGMFTITKDGILSITEITKWDYDKWDGTLVIPATVSGRKVTSLKSISEKQGSSFSNEIKNKLKHIEFSNDLEISEIPKYAFIDCEELINDFVLPSSVKQIREYAFANCNSFVGDLIIPSHVTEIYEGAFKDISNLNGSLLLNEGLESIGKQAFSGMSKLSIISLLPSSLIKINEEAFAETTSLLGELEIPKSILANNIGNSIFSNSSLGVVKVSEELYELKQNNPGWASGFWDGNDSDDSNVKLANKNPVIVDGDTITISEEWLASPDYDNWNGELIIPESAVKIPDNFAEKINDKLTTISFVDNKSIKEIGISAFNGCEELTGIIDLPEIKEIKENTFRNTKITSVNLLNAELIDSNAFESCLELANVNLPMVKKISDNAFKSCVDLNSINVKSVEELGSRAFYNCETLSSLHETKFKNKMFRSELAQLNKIGAEVFYGTSNLVGDLKIPNAIEILDKAFNNSMFSQVGVNRTMFDKQYDWKDSFSARIYDANADVTMLDAMLDGTLIINPDWLETSEYNDWNGEIIIPREIRGVTITGIATNFSDGIKDKLKKVSATQDCRLTVVGANAFIDSSINTFDIPTVTIINNNAFKDAKELTSIQLPKISEIKYSAFENCSKLSGRLDITNARSVWDGAFSGASANGLVLIVNKELYDSKNIWGSGFWDGKTDATSNIKFELPQFNVNNGVLEFNLPWLQTAEGKTWNGNLVIPANYDGQEVKSLNNYNGSSGDYFARQIKTKITSLSFENNSKISSIPNFAFYDCTSLKTINLGNVTSVGESAFTYFFNNASKLETIISPKLKTIKNSAFKWASNLKGDLTFPEVTFIEEDAFAECETKSYVSLTFPKLSESEDYLFSDSSFSYVAVPTPFYDTIQAGLNNWSSLFWDYSYDQDSNVREIKSLKEIDHTPNNNLFKNTKKKKNWTNYETQK
ncbi:MAG: leucine-rich repeat protein [Mycoplasma sp.]